LLLALIDQLPEKVLSLGDLVSLSFRKFRQNGGLYWQALIMPALGAAVGSNGAFFAFHHWVSIASKSMLAVGPFAIHMALVLLGITVWFVSIWQLLLRASAIIRLMLGLDQDYATAYKHVKTRSGPIFAAYNLLLFPPLVSLLLWTFVAFLIVSFLPQQDPQRLIVGSLGFGLIGFGLTVSISLSSLFGAILVVIIACEPLPFNECVNRAYFFFRLRLLRGGSFICLMTVALVLVYVACFSPIFLLALAESYTHADLGLASRSVLVQFVKTVLDTTFNVVSFGIGFTGYGLFYRDLTLRLEGQDLLNKIERLAAG
jgi:hypothetical protein